MSDSCPWPHEDIDKVMVYDRDSFDKYKSGVFKLPTHCTCGAELHHTDDVAIVLVERGEMTGDMILSVPVPLSWVDLHHLRKHSAQGMRETEWFEKMKELNPSCPGCKHLVSDCRCDKRK